MAGLSQNQDISQPESAAYQARITVLKCLSTLSLATGEGEVFEPHEIDQLNFDPLAGVDPGRAEAWLKVAFRCLSIDWASEKHSWLEELRAIVDETEQAMDFAKPLAVLRSPEGLSSILMLATNWDTGLRRLGLPSALPPEWLGQSGAEAPAQEPARPTG